MSLFFFILCAANATFWFWQALEARTRRDSPDYESSVWLPIRDRYYRAEHNYMMTCFILCVSSVFNALLSILVR